VSVAEGFKAHTDTRNVYTIAVPEAAEVLVRDEAELQAQRGTLSFSWLVLGQEGLVVRTSCARLEEWHKHICYNRARTQEEYAREAVEMYEARSKHYFKERAASAVQWDKNLLVGKIPGGVNCVRLATWWGSEPELPHSFTCFAAVSEHWIVTGSIEEEVPLSTGDIMASLAFLEGAAHPASAASNWD